MGYIVLMGRRRVATNFCTKRDLKNKGEGLLFFLSQRKKKDPHPPRNPVASEQASD